MKTSVKSCLIVSYGPVPTPEYQTVEGGGMRAWGLAEGLVENGIETTVAVNASFPQKLNEYSGIKITNWSLDPAFIKLINSFDAVIISYCMGDPSVFVANNINNDVQLILDAYVPIYIEVSARDSDDLDTEYTNYMLDIKRFNDVLKRGDYFLYANEAQKLFYTGVLSALGIINPKSYRDIRMIKTPFGIHRTPLVTRNNPYKNLGISDDDFVVLWFGGIYPWFHIEEYLKAIDILSSDKNIKFVFVGGKNPFNPNPDFSRQYETTVSFAKKHDLINKQVYFVDWVDFSDRVDWFTNCNVIISINKPGEENQYSWRTRVMDFVWGEAVIISNGGDPLSEELINSNAAIRINELSSSEIVKTISRIDNNPSELSKAKINLVKLKQSYFWDIVTAEVAKTIKSGDLPFSNEERLRNIVGPNQTFPDLGSTLGTSKLTKAMSIPFVVTRKIRQKGVLRTSKIAASVIKTQVKRNVSPVRESQFVFISHPINNTGAPIVLLQIIDEYVKKYGPNRVRVIAPGIEKEQNIYLKRLGVSLEHCVYGASFRFIRLQLNLRPDDFVLMNTAAIYDNYRDFVLLWLRNKRLKHAYWFIHEDKSQLPVVHKEFLDKNNLKQIRGLINDHKLSVLVPSLRTKIEYDELLDTSLINTVNLHVDINNKLKIRRTLKEYDEINFLISGTPSDGRKGQVLALSAFTYFYHNYYLKNPSNYRGFKLRLVAIGDDYISQQIKWICESLLSDHYEIYASLPKEKALELTSTCNAVICCSLNETFGLYVAEGMLMGHFVLRNNSAGVDEQLVDGKNGYLIDHKNIKHFADTIERVLNKEMANSSLQSMGRFSQKIMGIYTRYNYIDQIEKTT